MSSLIERLGAIEELESGLQWDAPTLAAEIARRRSELSHIGVGRSSRIAIVHGGSARFFADLLSVWTVGATAICLDPSLTASELKLILQFVRPTAVLVDGSSPAWIEKSICASVLDLRETPVRPDVPQPHNSVPDDDPALVLLTSGTTGAPKGVVLSFGALSSRLAANVAAIGRDALTRTLVTLPTHFGHGLIGNSLTPLLAGGDIVLPASGAALLKDIDRIIDDRRITFMTSVPTFWRMALSLGAPPQSGSLVRVHIGSAPLSATLWSDVAAWSRAEVVNCYGMTETANWFAGASSRDAVADGLVGTPWGGTAGVVSGDGVVSLEGEGEIVVRTHSLMSGYLDRPDLTELVLRDGWYRTGDSGHIDDHGRIWLTGRIKDEINCAGFKVQPAEIDRLLETHPAVREACTFAIPDPVSGEAVAVAITLAEGAQETVRSLRGWCRERLRREGVPERWFIVDGIPRTERGKVNRDIVRRMLFKD